MSRSGRLLVATQAVETGVPIHVRELLDGLTETSVEIDVACPQDALLWRALEGRQRVSLHPLAGARRPAPSDLGDLRHLMQLASRATVIHLHSAKAGFLGRLAAMLLRRNEACLFTPHAWSFWAFSGPEAAVYRRLERLAARWCRWIVAVSEDERAAGLEAGVGRSENYRLIYNGVDAARFDLARSPAGGRILFVGRLSAQKRPDVAVRVLERVRRRQPAAELHLVGGGDDEGAVRRLAGELGLAEAVRFLGRREDIPELLSRADCLLLTSDYESCPITVLEAMAASVPVVATSVGGVPELVADGETGLLRPAGDVEALAAAVTRLTEDGGLAARLGAAGRARALSKFSLQQMRESTYALYAQLGLRLG